MAPVTESGGASPARATAPELTWRAIGTGMLLGGLLAPCNIYAGLKVGWMFNLSVTAALMSFAFWQGLHRSAGTRPWGLLENNINQTAASSAASIASAGLVAPIPALTMLTGESLRWSLLVFWVLSVSLLGIAVAVGLRRQMLIEDELPFPAGIATAATVKELYGRGSDAMARLAMLVAGAVAAAGVKLVDSFVTRLPKLGPPSSVAIPVGGALSQAGGSVTLRNLGFVLDPSLLMVGFGAIVGMRASLSLLGGGLLAWGAVGPWALAQGWAHPGAADPDALWFGEMLEWLLWPGVSMMVAASLTSVLLSWRSVLAALTGRRTAARTGDGDVPREIFLGGLLVALGISVIAQHSLFGIDVPLAIFAVLLTFVLAMVAARVSGETGITPIGAMGKVTQLTFGVVSPGSASTNLMAANVTGGAAGQCADLLHDMKTGLLVGATPRHQTTAQLFGVLAGALVGTGAYLVLVPDPATMLLTDEWPAPAVATWKAVAEVFLHGADAMPPGSVAAMIVAGLVGVALAVAERRLPPRLARFVPSAASVGLAFVIPFYNSLSMFLGAILAFVVQRRWPDSGERFVIVLAAGLVAGESLAGVGSALIGVLAR